jgi:anti-anti-sigma regulatory factor
MDLTRVQRVFDSGIALLRMLSEKLHRVGARVVVVGDHPDVRRQIPLILGS